MGEGVKAKNEKWWTRAYARTRESFTRNEAVRRKTTLTKNSSLFDSNAVRCATDQALA